MKVRIEFDDGKQVEAVANVKTLFGVASKSAFKRQFGVPATVLSFWGDAYLDSEDEDKPAKLNPDLTPEQLQHIDEEYMAFLVWMELKRRRPDQVPDEPWDKAVERIAVALIDAGDEGEDEDPTKATST